MKIHYSIFTAVKRLFILCGLVHICALSAYAVTDPTNDGAYTTFSTVYGGKRYYLGVDTVKAKADTPIDTVTWYEDPNYATMWQMGKVQQSGTIYQSTIKSVWLAERITAPARTKKFLSLGTDKGTYTPLVLKDTAQATLWRAEAAIGAAKNKYVEGYVYYFSDATGVDMYRYITYDPLYKFSRTYSSRPTAPFRVTVWSRKTGNDLQFTFYPVTQTFGLELEKDTTILHTISSAKYYEGVDRFVSREGRMEVFANEGTVTTNPSELVSKYGLFGYYEWKSNPRTPSQQPNSFAEDDTYDGKSKMRYWDENSEQWRDSTVMEVRIKQFHVKEDGLWHDTLYAIGTSPFNVMDSVWDAVNEKYVPGTTYRNHSDWLYIRFKCNGESYVDSAYLVRQTFHNNPYVTMNLTATPVDTVFKYTSTDSESLVAVTAVSDTAKTFGISGRYVAGGRVLYTNGAVAQNIAGERDNVAIHTLPKTTYNGREYDTLKVEALNADGTSAIYNASTNPSGWIESVRLVDKDSVRVKIMPFATASTRSRSAYLRVSYNFLHSTAIGDTVLATRNIWITQAGSSGAGVYDFRHKNDNIDLPQPVHTKVQEMYGIPGEALQLPIHRDYWGYYRWYQWDSRGNGNEVAVNNNTWTWVDFPQNNNGDDLMPINIVKDPTSRGHWDIGKGYFGDAHYTPGVPTPVPSIQYPEVASKDADSLACDVSAYTNVETEGTIGTTLSSLTEPTLSYRNIFVVNHASIRAEEMEDCRTTGGERKWMEEHEVVVPAGRKFTLSPRCPVNDDDEGVEEGHLQYIYYFNPARTMGTDEGLDKSKAASYNRIGRGKYASARTCRRLTRAQIAALPDTTMNVVIVNPRKGGDGFVLGYKDDTHFNTNQDWIKDADNTAKLDNAILTNVVIPDQGYYILKMVKKDGKFTISYGNKELYLNQDWLRDKWYLSWSKKVVIGFSNNKWELNYFDLTKQGVWNTDKANLIDAGLVDDVVSLYIQKTTILYEATGCINASDYADSKFTPNPRFVDDNTYYQDLVNIAWVFYEVQEPGAKLSEIPEWQVSTTAKTSAAWLGNDGWSKVADQSNIGNETGYTMLINGDLQIDESVLTGANDTLYYRLKSQNFQLAKFTVITRSIDEEGPRVVSIITEETLLNDYDILLDFNSKVFDKPANTDPTSSSVHMDWEHSEMSFHDNSIDNAHRVNTSFLPGKGEYAFINKFVDPTNESNIIECLSGAQYGYMLCVNAAEKPVTIMRFEYDDRPCPDQQVYLTGSLCNPVKNGYEPQVTADLEGWNGSAWILVYRYKTGNIPFNEGGQPWYQFVLPIDRTKIAGYSKFRCTASLTGSNEQNAFLLIDRLRFIAKARPLTIFQNQTTCITGGKIDIVARLDYQNATNKPGTLMAYQYQKLNPSTHEFEPMATGEGGVTYVNDADYPGLDDQGNACGCVRIPAKDFTPAVGDTTTLDGVTLKTPRSYVNEGTGASKYWVMYISQNVSATNTDTFRVAMAVVPNASTPADFSTAGCATERVIAVHKPVELKVDGSVWTSKARDAEGVVIKSANDTYRLRVTLSDANLPSGHLEGSGKCKFDVLRSGAEDRDYQAKVLAWMADPTNETKKAAVDAADEWFKSTYGIDRNRFLNMMDVFRADDDRNPNRETSNWNDVKALDFTYAGLTPEQADSIYKYMDNLITKERKLQIGLEYEDVFLGNYQDAYFYVQPLPATGKYVVAATTKEEKIAVCNTPQWFEIHSAANNYTLRYGYDNIVNGNYEVPVIRATATEANAAGTNRLAVRVAAIASSNHTDTVVIGETVLIESNDPEWTGSKVFKYTPGKHMVVGQRPAETTYYTVGDTVQFAAATSGNTITLKGGYWYTFNTAFHHAAKETNFTALGETDGYAEFILAVAPDTVRWTPSHAESANYWNDDDNWTAIVGGADFHGCIATVPMGDTKVIIPAPEKENLLPLLSEDSALVARRVDTLDYGYKFNTCDKILFKPDAVMLGQELLDYNQAFVDVKFISGHPKTFTPTLEHVYAGDMYVPWDKDYYDGTPETGGSVDTVDFEPQPFPAGDEFDGQRYNPRMYPYAFFQSFYNTSLPVAYMNTDKDGHPLAHDTISKNVIAWSYTNMLDKHYAPGTVCMIDCYDANDDADREIIVRLPKKDNEYYYFYKLGDNYYSSWHVDLKIGEEDRTYEHLSHNLAYDKSKLVGTGDDIGVDYTLTNLISSDLFFFGNPTMSLIDVYTLCVDNADKLKYEDGKYYFTTYVVGESSSYVAGSITGPGQYYIAPQRAVGLVAKEACKELTIRLKPHAMVAMTGDKSVVDRMPRRRMPKAGEPEGRYLYISAANETDNGECKSFITLGEQADALRGYRYGEDALSLTSGQYEFNYNSFNTPLGLYTIADNQPLMRDVRDSLGIVPIVFTKIEDKYSYADKTRLSFALDGEWDTPLYLFDALTGDSTLILNGLQIEVETPQNDQIRYYIHGRRVAQTQTTPGTATGVDPVTPENGTSSDNTNGLTSIYDVLGRKIMTLQEHDLISNIQLPTGVYIIQRGTKSERMVIR